MLEIKGLAAGYHRKQVLYSVDLTVGEGECVAIVGHNGAGKTSLLRSAFGLLRPWQGMVRFGGRDLTGLPAAEHVKAGVVFVPQGRAVFADLTVRENLELGAHQVTDRHEIARRLQQVFSLFPPLADRLWQRAGTLSGGQQQMVALSVALMQGPRLLLLDEPSLGLAPVVVQRVLSAVAQVNRELGVSVILVEQNVKGALSVASRVYVLKTGRMTQEMRAEELAATDARSLL